MTKGTGPNNKYKYNPAHVFTHTLYLMACYAVRGWRDDKSPCRVPSRARDGLWSCDDATARGKRWGVRTRTRQHREDA